MTTKPLQTIEAILLDKFNVYYSEYDGQYHNGRQADATVPFEDAVAQLQQTIEWVIGEDENLISRAEQRKRLTSIMKG